MEEKLVTLAILTYSKALILKNVLESEGIETYIQNVNQIQPMISSGVRIRIREKDLPHALEITESSAWLSEDVVQGNAPQVESSSNNVLIPIDFSSNSVKACEIGFSFAKATDSEVTILHVYFTPIHANPLQYGDFFKLTTAGTNENIDDVISRVNANLKDFSDSIAAKIKAGELPDVKYKCVLRDGIPEEEILNYSKKIHPRIIVMGTRGTSENDIEYMGSVTAEVIERTEMPVLAIPGKSHLSEFTSIKHMALLTGFDQRDLIAFDALIHNFKSFDYKIDLLHLTDHVANAWNEIKLAGIKEYFKKQYPQLDITYSVVANDQLLQNLDNYIKEQKIDIVAITSYKRNIFSRLFNPGMASKVLFHNDIPLLVLTQLYHKY